MTKKVKAFYIVLVIFAAAVSLGAIAAEYVASTIPPRETHTKKVRHTVKVGETFWDICAEYREFDVTDPYLPQFILENRKLNPAVDKDNGQIYPGQELVIEYKE